MLPSVRHRRWHSYAHLSSKISRLLRRIYSYQPAYFASIEGAIGHRSDCRVQDGSYRPQGKAFMLSACNRFSWRVVYMMDRRVTSRGFGGIDIVRWWTIFIVVLHESYASTILLWSLVLALHVVKDVVDAISINRDTSQMVRGIPCGTLDGAKKSTTSYVVLGLSEFVQ